ncbi:MAG: AI-2E family transporter [Planctomycetaceae bacterium]
MMQMAKEGDAYRERVKDLVEKTQVQINEFMGNESADLKSQLTEFGNFLDAHLKNLLTKLSAEMFALVTTSMVVLIYVFFLLLGSVGSGEKAPSRIDEQVRSYLSLKTSISMVTGAIFGLTLWLFGVPMAAYLRSAGLFNELHSQYRPDRLHFITSPVHHSESRWFTRLDDPGYQCHCHHSVNSGNVVEPKLMGSSSDLHPVVILLALMFWGMMWGITGMFLATPITAGLKIAFESFESTKPIAAVFAGQWDAIMPKQEKTEVT